MPNIRYGARNLRRPTTASHWCPCRRGDTAASPHSCRTASTSADPYPFPKNAHPTPHQIFHLPQSATRADVKARYYDLVRIYHPDSAAACAGGVPPDAAHARFQAIASAYAVLSGKKSAGSVDGMSAGEGPAAAARTTYHDLSSAMWRARQRRRAEMSVVLDDRWKERMMLGVVGLTVALFVIQTFTTRARALSESKSVRRASAGTESPASRGDLDARRLSADHDSPSMRRQ